MSSHPTPEAVLVTGVFGAGKSSVIIDVGTVLEAHGERYGLVDVDWLGWFSADESARAHERLTLSNVSALCTAYLGAGVQRLALAWAVRDAVQLAALRDAVPAPLRVVHLEVTADEIRRRLAGDPTEERQVDLAEAVAWLAEGTGAELADLVLPGAAPLRTTSATICSWLGWIPAGPAL